MFRVSFKVKSYFNVVAEVFYDAITIYTSYFRILTLVCVHICGGYNFRWIYYNFNTPTAIINYRNLSSCLLINLKCSIQKYLGTLKIFTMTYSNNFTTIKAFVCISHVYFIV